MSDPYPQSPQTAHPPPGTVPYAQPYYGSGPPGPPASIKVIGIVGVVLGSLSLLARLVGLIAIVAMPAMTAVGGPGYARFQVADIAAFAAAAAVLLAGSIGCLMRRDWGRRTLLAWAVGYPVLLVIEVAAMIGWMLPMLAARMPAGPGSSMMVTLGSVSNVLTALVLCVLPVFVLVLFRRPAVRAGFA